MLSVGSFFSTKEQNKNSEREGSLHDPVKLLSKMQRGTTHHRLYYKVESCPSAQRTEISTNMKWVMGQ